MQPMNLFDCLGTNLATTLIILSSVVTVLYMIIAWKFYVDGYKQSSMIGERRIWAVMIIDKILCAVCGYALFAVAGWNPDIAYSSRVVMTSLIIVICVVLLGVTKGWNLSASQKVRKRIDCIERMPNIESMSATEAMKLLKQALGKG